MTLFKLGKSRVKPVILKRRSRGVSPPKGRLLKPSHVDPLPLKPFRGWKIKIPRGRPKPPPKPARPPPPETRIVKVVKSPAPATPTYKITHIKPKPLPRTEASEAGFENVEVWIRWVKPILKPLTLCLPGFTVKIGPVQAGEAALMPLKAAEILVRQGIAEYILQKPENLEEEAGNGENME